MRGHLKFALFSGKLFWLCAALLFLFYGMAIYEPHTARGAGVIMVACVVCSLIFYLFFISAFISVGKQYEDRRLVAATCFYGIAALVLGVMVTGGIAKLGRGEVAWLNLPMRTFYLAFALHGISLLKRNRVCGWLQIGVGAVEFFRGPVADSFLGVYFIVFIPVFYLHAKILRTALQQMIANHP